VEQSAVILGRYELEERLGAGASGEVFRGFDRRLRRPVAIKALHADRIGDVDRRRRMEREVRAVASLDHPNIVRMLDSGDEGGRFYAVMSLVDGQTLRELLTERGAFEPLAVAAIVSAIARALGYAHEHGLLHRDVKPSNVMLSDEGTPVLLDFGLATSQEISRLTETTGIDDHRAIGTPPYMSPEQVRGAPPTPATDQWSLAVVAYELLTGEVPWRHRDSLPAMLAEILLEGPQPITAKSPELPSAVWQVLSRAFEREPTDRYPTVQAFADELDQALRHGTPPSGPERNAGRASRRRSVSWVGGLVAGGLAVAGAVLAMRPLGPGESDESAPSVAALPTRSGLACAPLAAPADEEWLGVAAASLACRRLRWSPEIGGEHRAREPADLAGLPRTALEPSPSPDPWGSSALLASAREAAARHRRLLDGHVSTLPRGGFEVQLRLRAAGGGHREGSGTGDALYEAVSLAVRDMLGNAGLKAPIPPELRPWFRFQTLEEAVVYEDLGQAVRVGRGAAALCRRLDVRQGSVPHPYRQWLQACSNWLTRLGIPFRPPELVDLDRTDPAELVWAASWNEAPCGRRDACTEPLRNLASHGRQPPMVKAHVLYSLASHHDFAGRESRAITTAIEALQADPTSFFPRELLVALKLRVPEPEPWIRGLLAWQPAEAVSWTKSSSFLDGELATRRAFLVSGGHPLHGLNHGITLLEQGSSAGALEVAARLRGDEELPAETAAADLEVRVLLAEGRLGAAYEAALSELRGIDEFGERAFGDTDLFGLWVLLFDLLDREEAEARELVQHLTVALERISQRTYGQLPLGCACLRLSDAPECAERLDRAIGEQAYRSEALETVLQAARALGGADMAATSRLLRRIVEFNSATQPSFQSCFLPLELIERFGLLEVASHQQPPAHQERAFFGLHPAVVPKLVRDVAACDALDQVRDAVDRWERVDAAIPLLDRLRDGLEACRRR